MGWIYVGLKKRTGVSISLFLASNPDPQLLFFMNSFALDDFISF